jgi:hypothetical protein
MKKVLSALLAVFLLSTFAFAINADPDPDMAEKWAFQATIKLPPVMQGKGDPLAAGDYYIPQGANPNGFVSLKAAVDSINANGVIGTVNLLLDADTLREDTFTFNAAMSAANNVVVKPAPGKDVVLIVTAGASMGNGPQMIGFTTGFVTFDGSNNGTDSRNLLVTTEQISPVVDVPFGVNAATGDTVVLKNLVIKNIVEGQTNFRYGAVINDKGGVWGFRVENCQIGTAERPVRRDGIAPWGGGATANQFDIVNNEVYCGTRGVATIYLTESKIVGNTFNIMPTTAVNTNNYNHGIYITGAIGNTTIHNNVINCLEKTNVAGTYLIGIAFAGNSFDSTDVISVVNNMINVGAADEVGSTYGIGLRSAGNMGNIQTYHNTIVINDNASTLRSHGVGNHTNGTGPVNVDLKNNIIINNHTGSTESSAIGLIPATSVLASDYNLLASDQNFVNFQGTTYADLATWQATGRDVNSVTKDVFFVGADDLHLAGASVGDFDLAGTPAVAVLEDIDGDNRGLGYPYMGADEADVPLVPEYTAPTVFFSEYIEGSSNNKALEIYNGTGAEINLNDYRVAIATNGGGWFASHSFTADATLAAEDVWVIITDQTSADLFPADSADQVIPYSNTSPVHFNGDDARGIEWTMDGGLTWVLIDVIGDPNNDPGTNWPVAGVGATSEYTLVRKETITNGNIVPLASFGTTEENSEWYVFPQNTFTYLGSHPYTPPSYPDPIELYTWWEMGVTEYDFFANDNNTRGMAMSPDGQKIYVPSRSGGTFIYVLDAETGDSLDVLDMTDVTDGYYGVSLMQVQVDADGVIYACNLASGGDFKIYRWADDDAVPTVAYTATVTQRTGDSFGLSGTGSETVLYASGTGNTTIEVLSTADGLAYTAETPITVATGLARGGIEPVDDGIWINGTGTAVTKIDYDGTVLATLGTDVVPSSYMTVNYLELLTGEKVVALAGGNVTGTSEYIQLWEVSNLDDPWLYATGMLTGTWNANINGTGAALMFEAEDGTLMIAHMVSNNGLAMHSNIETPPAPDYDIVEDFTTADDVANWRSDNSGWTGRTHVDGTLQLADGGWTFDARRDVMATPNTFFKATATIKTSGSWSANPETQYLRFGVDGLGDQTYQVSCVSDSVFTTFTVIGYAVNGTGTLFIAGQGGEFADTAWVDDYSYDDNFMPDVTTISTITEAKAIPDGEWAATKGVVTATTIGAPIFIQDENAGISVYDWDFINDGIVKEGDEILVIGKRSTYRGLVQLQNTDDNYIVLSENHPVEPTLITVPDLESRDYQGMLVKLEAVDTVGTLEWPAEGMDANIDLKDADGNEFVMRIDKDGDMDGAPAPDPWPLTLIGVVGEFDVPQVLPRYMDDFITNQPPADFVMLNPADSAVINSLDDPAFDEVEGEKMLFVNWTEAIDPDPTDTVLYQLVISDGPDYDLITADTMIYVPIPEDTPWDMNGVHTFHVIAHDPMGNMTSSDTVMVTFDFPAPPKVIFTDVVLVENMPKLYAQFDMDIDTVTVANFMIHDQDMATAAAPTALEMVGTNAVMLSGDLPEDHYIALEVMDVVAPGGDVSIVDTLMAGQVLIPFSAAHPEDAIHMINDFEDGIGTFKQPTFSGSTVGLDATTSFAVSEEAAFEGAKSGKLTLVDNPDITGGWYVRMLHSYPFTYEVETSSTLMLMVKGTNAEVEMRLSITENPGYEQSAWQRVTLSEDDWQVVSFDLTNDEAFGWINGNGIVEGETVLIEGIHMRCAEDIDVELYLDGFTERKMVTPVDVTFEVNMGYWTDLGKFNPASDFVDIAGNLNGWAGGDLLEDADGDTVYALTMSFIPGQALEFKFRINGSWDDATCEFPSGGPNRTYTVPDTASVYYAWYNDEERPVGIENLIPLEFALHHNFPNPFNPITHIKYDLPEATDVKMVVFNALGQKVVELVNRYQQPGYYQVAWDGRNAGGQIVPSGVYFYVIQTEKNMAREKMIFLK